MTTLEFLKIRKCGAGWIRKRRFLRKKRQLWMICNYRSGESVRSLCRRCAADHRVTWQTCYNDWRALWEMKEHLTLEELLADYLEDEGGKVDDHSCH